MLQLNAGGTSASLINTITPSPVFTNTAANIGGMAFDALATVGTLTGTSTHAVEQGAAIDLLLAAPTITDVDGDHLASVTVQITGGTFVSNETSANDDHLFALDGVLQRTTGTFTGTNITVSYTVATETLTLTGYDTFANYQTVLNSIGYFTTGDNPTNYGNNTTRTITWQINDGAVGNPSGTVNGASTNVRTTTINIDAVNDNPVNNALANQTTPEDTPEAISFSVSDVDADPANQNITVRLQVTQGTLDINTAVGGGLTAGQVTGDNTNDVLLTGTQNQINATLANATGPALFQHAGLQRNRHAHGHHQRPGPHRHARRADRYRYHHHHGDAGRRHRQRRRDLRRGYRQPRQHPGAGQRHVREFRTPDHRDHQRRARHRRHQQQQHGRQLRRRLPRLHPVGRFQRHRHVHLHGDLGRHDRDRDRQRHHQRGRRHRGRLGDDQRGHPRQHPGAGERHLRERRPCDHRNHQRGERHRHGQQ